MHWELTIDLLPICFQIMEESLRKFAAENFSHRYFPALHGEIDKVQPLTMVVQKNRPLWKRPFVKLEVIVLAELAKYVKSEEDTKVFRDYAKCKIKEEMLISSPHETIAMGFRYDHALTQFLRAWHINVLHLNEVCLIKKRRKNTGNNITKVYRNFLWLVLTFSLPSKLFLPDDELKQVR